MSREYRVGPFLFWYDRSLRLWTITKRDEHDNQIGEAIYATSKDEAMVTAQSLFAEWHGVAA